MSSPQIDEKLLEILVCPVDKEPVQQQGDFIVCTACKRKYPIRDGIPVMLVDEAIVEDMPPQSEDN